MSKLRWFARGGGVACMGPFPSQVAAANAVRLVGGDFPADAFLWPEEAKKRAGHRRGKRGRP